MVSADNDEEQNEELYVKLREKFLKELEEKSGATELYDPDDIERIKTDDSYCQRFILHKKGDFDKAYAMLVEALAWRKSFNVKGCTFESIPPDFFHAKAVFPYNFDKDGYPVILLLVRHHKRDAKFATDLRRFIIYWVEKMEEQSNGTQMTVVMNCTDSGLSNLDLDMIKFLITLFRSYYPHSLAHILIYEMPWIFNAAWKIIKSWLPEDFVEKIVFVNKSNVQNYITSDNLSLEMGGTCAVEYEPPPHPLDENKNDVSLNAVEGKTEDRKVHFSENGIDTTSETSLVQPRLARENVSQLLITDDYCILAGIIKISPPQDLVFYWPPKDENNQVVIKLTSVAARTVTYKVKTNNIESYRVKPSIGIIEPNNIVEITVFLVHGQRPLPSDKFLIMGMELPVDSSTYPSLSHLWRTSPSHVMADYKLRCVVSVPESEKKETKIENSLRSIDEKFESLHNKIESLEGHQKLALKQQKISNYLLLSLIISLWGYVIATQLNIL